jgi:ketosteroid isomerase-like protein
LNSFSDLFATDGVLELPFHTKKSMRLVQGRENIRSYLATMPATLLKPIEYRSMTIHETKDPEVMMASMTYMVKLRLTASIFRGGIFKCLRFIMAR